MSLAEHMARFSGQFALDIGSEAAPVPTLPPREPTHAVLVAAALKNESVLYFIETSVPTWSRARVERNPPCYLVYEQGEVFGSVEDLPCMMRHAEKRGGLGRRLGVRPLRPDDDVLAYNIGVRRGPTHPARFRYEQRIALKRLLPREDRPAVWWAMRKTQRRFLAWAEARPGLDTRVADATGLSLVSFWRVVRGKKQ